MHEIGIEEKTMVGVYLNSKGGSTRFVSMPEDQYNRVRAGEVYRDHVPGDWYYKTFDNTPHPNVPDRAEAMAKVDAAAEQLKAEAVKDGDLISEIRFDDRDLAAAEQRTKAEVPPPKGAPPKDQRRK